MKKKEKIQSAFFNLEIDEDSGFPYWSGGFEGDKEGTDFERGESIPIDPIRFPPGSYFVIYEPDPDDKYSRKFYLNPANFYPVSFGVDSEIIPYYLTKDSASKANRYSFKNRDEIKELDKCACYYCLGRFPAEEIVEWVDKGKTALCPLCGIDSVLSSSMPFELTDEFLKEAKDRWF